MHVQISLWHAIIRTFSGAFWRETIPDQEKLAARIIICTSSATDAAET